MTVLLGWDIGGVNVKVAAVAADRQALLATASEPFELQRAPAALAEVLRALAGRVGASDAPSHAVTMTAELSQFFRLKAHGVAFVLDAVTAAFPRADVRVFAVDGRFLSPDAARSEPLAVAASNWAATARVVAGRLADAILIDTGSTTTDVIPVVGGRVAATGWTDPDRLRSGELVYTGALRAPVESVLDRVPFRGGEAYVSAEGFALVGDAHLWRGALAPADYTVAAPDGRPATREFAGERLARVVCADRGMVSGEDLDRIAAAVHEAQVARIAEAVGRVHGRHPAVRRAVTAGLGEFLAAAAAARAGLDVAPLAGLLGADASRVAPAAAVALLLAAGG